MYKKVFNPYLRGGNMFVGKQQPDIIDDIFGSMQPTKATMPVFTGKPKDDKTLPNCFFAPGNAPTNSGVEEELLESMLTRQIQEAARFFPNGVTNTLKMDGVFLCGGSLIDTIDGGTINDYDFFFTRQGAFDAISGRYDHITKIESKDAITVGKMQFIRRYIYQDVTSIFATFDLTCVQIAFDGENVFFGPTTIHDLLNKFVRVNNATHPYKSLKRLMKFAKRGYNVEDAYENIIDSLKKTSPYTICQSEDCYI